MAKRFFQTSNGKKGGELKGKAHYDSDGKPLGGIKAVVTDQGGAPVELESSEVIVNKKTVQSDKVLTVKGTPKQILSTLNQMDGNGVAIGDSEAEILAKYKDGGKIGSNDNEIKVLGFSDENTICDRCGRTELKGTYSVLINGELYHLGTSCIAKKMDITTSQVKTFIDKEKKARLEEQKNEIIEINKDLELEAQKFRDNWDHSKHDYMIWEDSYYNSIRKKIQQNKQKIEEKYNIRFKTGGEISQMTPSELKAFYATDEGKKLDAETYAEWKRLVNMTKSELENFYHSEEGLGAGLSRSEASKHGIDSGRESAEWIMKMKDIPYKEWTSDMWRWAKKQISFIKRMSGVKGELYDDKGRKTRKHTALLIWGHNPEKKFEGGGEILWATKIGEPDYNEQLITENPEHIENAKKWALANGFDRIRVSSIDNSNPDFTKGFKKFKGGGEISQKALAVETTDLKDYVRKYFIKDGRIDVSDAMQELFGNKKGKSIAGEYRKRIGLHKKGGLTISQLSHKLWEEHKDDVRSDINDSDFREAVEEVITSEYGVNSMIKNIMEKSSQGINEDENEYWMNQYDESQYEEPLNDEEMNDYFIGLEQLESQERDDEESIPNLIEGLKILLEYVKGEEKTEVENTIEGLEILLESEDIKFEGGGSIENEEMEEKTTENFKPHKTVQELAELHKVPVSEILKQLHIGEKIEMEHTTDYETARIISLQHIEESPQYYTLLESMEEKFELGGELKEDLFFEPSKSNEEEETRIMENQFGKNI
jgi:hypothetical protein